jgi:hypothetical protein
MPGKPIPPVRTGRPHPPPPTATSTPDNQHQNTHRTLLGSRLCHKQHLAGCRKKETELWAGSSRDGPGRSALAARVRAAPTRPAGPEISAHHLHSTSFGAFGRGLAGLCMTIVHDASRLGGSAASVALYRCGERHSAAARGWAPLTRGPCIRWVARRGPGCGWAITTPRDE